MHSELLHSKSWFIEKHLSNVGHPMIESAKKLLLVSDFACRQVNLLLSLLQNDPCDALLSREDYFSAVNSIQNELPQVNYMRELRHFRHTHFLRLLLWEHATAIASTEAIMRAWSDCADALTLHVLNYCAKTLSSQYGKACDEQGLEVQLYVLAMGKLGGRELNYSSDIDLIFVYDASGYTDGIERLGNQEYFTKLVQQFTQIMQCITADGFAFRVDLRLRPNGDSGPLVSSLASMETYYQEQGRDWERYAMVKARVITPSLKNPAWFKLLITPFVYRRYVDFSVIEALRSMKAMIEREVQLNPSLNDIKRGGGGIREIEFIIQNVQLIRGGLLPQLQQSNALSALTILKEKQLLPRSEALKQAYLFLRKLENVLQSLNDQQTHSLPQDGLKQIQVYLAMDYTAWDDLLDQLHQYQRIVGHAFHIALGKVDTYEDEKRLFNNQLSRIWQGQVEEHMAINWLSSIGYENSEHCYYMLHTFRHSPRCKRLSQSARLRLDRFMVLLLSELMHFEQTDTLLLHVVSLLETIVGRSPYLALLTENPQALKELLFWFTQSPFIRDLLVNQPFLLEILLNQEKEWKPLSLKQLALLLTEKLVHCNDLESQEEGLRHFKLTHWLMAARSELYGICPSVRISQFLSDLAQVIILKVLELAVHQLELRFPEMSDMISGFTLIAYGTLGSREMNYTSDLDLVFLYDAEPSKEALVTRLTQKILHMLTTRAQSGVLYSVDTRLRPSGAAGLLVSTVSAFVQYQTHQAWTWEHQALLKARIISYSPRIKRRFLALKRDVLSKSRDSIVLREAVWSMREKMNLHQGADSIKYSQGGLLDLEFLIQYLMLNQHDPSLARYTQTLSQIQQLFLAQVLNSDQCRILKKAYKMYHHLLHQQLLGVACRMNVEGIEEEVRFICSLFRQSNVAAE